jgi:hypothetical protein
MGLDWFAAGFGKQKGGFKGVESGDRPLMADVGLVLVIL